MAIIHGDGGVGIALNSSHKTTRQVFSKILIIYAIIVTLLLITTILNSGLTALFLHFNLACVCVTFIVSCRKSIL